MSRALVEVVKNISTVMAVSKVVMDLLIRFSTFLVIWFSTSVFFSSEVYAQGAQVAESSSVSRSMSQYVSQNLAKEKIAGWRVVLSMTDDRRKIERDQYKFKSLYPGRKVEWEHKNPFYLLSCGAFESKLSAQSYLNRIKKEFPDAILKRANDIDRNEMLQWYSY